MVTFHENAPPLSQENENFEIQKITAGVIFACWAGIVGIILVALFLGA